MDDPNVMVITFEDMKQVDPTHTQETFIIILIF